MSLKNFFIREVNMTLKNLLALKDELEENNIEVRSQDVDVRNT